MWIRLFQRGCLVGLIGLACFCGVGWAKPISEFSGKFAFDQSVYLPDQPVRVSIATHQDLNLDLKSSSVWLVLVSETDPQTSGYFEARIDAPVSSVEEDPIPLAVASPRELRATLHFNRWLPEGPYRIKTVEITQWQKIASGVSQSVTVGKILSPYFDSQGGITKLSAPLSLRGTDPDIASPILDQATFSPDQIHQGEVTELALQYEDDKSGLSHAFGVLRSVKQEGSKYRVQEGALQTLTEVDCEFGNLPLKGTTQCPLPQVSKLPPGLYAITQLQLDDRRGWGNDLELNWVMPYVGAGGILVSSDLLKGGALLGGESRSMKYWKARGHHLDLPLPVLEIK